MNCRHSISSGHNIANLDPLGIGSADLDLATPPELQAHEAMDPEQVCLRAHTTDIICICSPLGL